MPPFIETVLRSRDLLHVQFEFVNLELHEAAATAPVLRRRAPGPAFIVVRLPPQHIAEEAFDATVTRLPPYDARLASPTRLAFKVRDTTTPIPFTVDGLLRELGELALWIPDEPGTAPGTFIEFPDRVLLVPEPDTRLSHRSGVLSSDNNGASEAQWTELWHTRLVSATSTVIGGVCFRAVANPTDKIDRLANGILTLLHRREIVRLCSNPPSRLVGSSSFVLTPLGASAHMKSLWPAAASPHLSTWEHETVTGRDRFVRIVEQGFLYPFGHRASRQTIVRRNFSTLSGSVLFAGLKKHLSITVEEAERDYAALRAYQHEGREMPLKQIRIVSQLSDVPSENAPIRFGVNARDDNGHLIACDLTMFFVTAAQAADPAALARIHVLYLAHNSAVLRSQHITLADDGEGRGDTTLNVTKLAFKVVAPRPGAEAMFPPFLPALETADASIPAVEHWLGTVSAGPAGMAPVTTAPSGRARVTAAPTRTLRLLDSYLAHGFQATDDKQAFARFEPAMPALSIPAERAGGIAAPEFQPMDGLSRVRGLVADVEGFAAGSPIDLRQLLGDAKLLGVIELKTLIDTIVDHVPADRPEVLFDSIATNADLFATRPVLTSVQSSSGVETRFLWKPRIKAALTEPLTGSDTGPVSLLIRGGIRTSPVGGSQPVFEVEGTLQNFGLKFDELLTVRFNHVIFTSGGGRKMDVKVAVRDVHFERKLSFINKIGELLTKNNIGRGPSVRPQADGVVVSFGIGLPSFAMGLLSFQNIAVGSSISLPFVEKPASVRFSLSERSHPFLVSVSIFGGTGFFAIEVRTDKSVLIEAGIEFGGVVSINLLGIVRGGVYVFVGIFVLVDSHGHVAITGHLRFGGYVDVAGLITISIEFYIALTYIPDDQVLIGVGRVTIGVKLLFFSISRTFEVTRRIKGFGEPPEEGVLPPEGDAEEPPPTFASTVSELQWEQYCTAFA